jgi:hypothetical protein
MQDIDRPTHIQALPHPARARRACVEAQSVRDLPRAENLRGIGGHGGRRRHVGEGPSVRPPELQRTVKLSLDLEALLVDGAVVPSTLCRLRFYAALGLGVGGARWWSALRNAGGIVRVRAPISTT